ncbi:hypothetical protein EXD82_08715 [Peptacetobacter hominis]|uniref:Solute-binding protein family 5 domain-containing protein n=1 Tax=Peptacetobacter hominis TaxID=2743610 RepID=A0A544QTQ9_9FIRM|nr:ABC transporter substrate-binding protein [Peptacetobacter hominis]TQQ84075.1 hypothetical protein EXD82_08715 [Peptacetobacter hominis]
MKSKKLFSVLLSAAMATGILTGCGGSGGNSSEAKDTIVYSMNTTPQGIFNPLISNIKEDDYVNAVVYASLMQVNEKGEIVPYLAEKSEVSEDMKTITYDLKDNATWHDGEKVTAEDVAFTLKSMADGGYTGGYYGDVQNIKGAEAYHNGEAEDVEGIKVVDDDTIEIQFEKVYAPAVTNIGNLKILPEHIWGEVPVAEWQNKTDLLNKPVGCGPYKLTEFTSGSNVKFEAASDFFDGAAKTKNLIFKVINADTTQAEFKSGSIDIANVEALKKDDVSALENEGYKLVEFPNYMFTYMGFNLRNEKLRDKNIRQAFMYAVDRQSILDNIVEGRGEIVNTPMLPSSWAYPEESELNAYKYDTEKAKELLKAAGYEDKDGDGFVENSAGEKLKFSLVCQTDNDIRQKVAVSIQEAMKAVGVEIEIDSMEYSAVMDKVVANHDYDLYMMGNTLSLDPDPRPMWHSEAISNEAGVIGYNIVAYNNPETDALIEKGNATLDQEERKSAYAEFGKKLNEDVPEMYLFCQNIERVYNSKLEGYTPSTFNEFYNVNNWVIK